MYLSKTQFLASDRGIVASRHRGIVASLHTKFLVTARW